MLKLNVGLSRKVGETNYGSRGASVNLELELDSGLAAEPDRLKDRIRFLFGLAKASVDEELNGQATNGHSAEPASSPSNGQANGRRGDSTRRATASQVRALHAIAKRKTSTSATSCEAATAPASPRTCRSPRPAN